MEWPKLDAISLFSTLLEFLACHLRTVLLLPYLPRQAVNFITFVLFRHSFSDIWPEVARLLVGCWEQDWFAFAWRPCGLVRVGLLGEP